MKLLASPATNNAGKDGRAIVCHIINGLQVAGAETMLFRLLKHGSSENLSRVISLHDDSALGAEIRSLGILVDVLGMGSPIPTPSAIFKFFHTVSSSPPDLLHGWMYHGSLAALSYKLLKAKRSALIWNIRQSIYDLTLEKKTTQAVIKACALLSGATSRIVYNSTTAARQHESLGFDSRRTRVIPNGFDLSQYDASEARRQAARAWLKVSDAECVIGVVARVHAVKDHTTLLNAVARVVRVAPNVRLVLAGRDACWENERLARSISNLELSDHVVLLGERHDLPSIMPGFDIGCSSSLSEGFSNAIGEIMACAVPCVVTNVGESQVLIGDTGVSVPSADAFALSEGLLSLVQLSSAERRQLGVLARKRIAAQYSIQAVALAYDTLYSEALEWRTRPDREESLSSVE
jgi:glycosyltransferase involved in cell wall biosynthesis